MNKKYTFALLTFMVLIPMISIISAVSLVNVQNNPSQVSPGEQFTISMGVKNILDDNVYNLNVKLDLTSIPFAPYESSSEKFIDEIRDGKTENIEFNLIALPSASSGIYKLPIEITYEKSDGSEASKSELISVTINSQPEIKISLEDGILIRGRENTLSLKIINSGLSDIKFSYVTMSDASGIQFLSNKEEYLGDIDSNDFDSADFSVYISPDAPDFIILPVAIRYKDSTNKQFVENKQIPVKTFSTKEAQNIGLLGKPNYVIYIIITILIATYFVRKFLKKRKKNRR